jgi:hypothetical protein
MGTHAEEATRLSILADGVSPESLGRDYWIYDQMLPVHEELVDEDGNPVPLPNFTVKETAKMFFARSADWLRWRGRAVHNGHKADDGKPCNDRCHPLGFFVLDDVVIEPRRTEAGARFYTLADVERMAHALAQNGALSTEKLIDTIMLIKWEARLYEVDIENGIQ